MKTELEISIFFNVASSIIYNAWLDSDLHSRMTGGEATCNSVIGGEFTAWEGYITGKNIELIENKKIVQSWRTSEFKKDDEDSQITISFLDVDNRCKVVLNHINIPENQPDYAQGWEDHYFEPMSQFFTK